VSGKLRVGVEAVNGADLGEQLRGQRSAAGKLEEPRCELCGPPFQLAVEFGDQPRQRATAAHELTSDPGLDVLLRHR
jgi:hypothetical protein